MLPELQKSELIELLNYLTPQELDEMDSLLWEGNTSSSDIWEPFPDTPQEIAYHSPADVVGYGGAAGGGKTDLGLGLAFTNHRRSIIFRERFTDLGGIIDRGNEIQDGRCSFVWGVKRRWETPDGRLIEVGAGDHERDKKKYKRPHDLIVIDEAADFPESFVRFVTGWLRTEIQGQRTRIVMTFNPPTDETGEWIIQYFSPWLDPQHPNPALPGELRWFIRVNDKDVEVTSGEPVEIEGETYTPQSRTFIQALVEDNPFYMATGYAAQLESLPEPLRSQLRYGDFTIRAEDNKWQTIPTVWVLEAEERYRQGQRPPVTMTSAGVDVARGGKDNTVIAPLYGSWFDEPQVHPGSTTPDGQTVAMLVTQAVPSKQTRVMIDVVGYGASAYDHLRVVHANTTPVNNAEAAPNGALDKSERFGFANLRAYCYWKFREALDPASGQNIALPPVRRLRTDLCAPRYKIVGGKIAIESKEDIIKRTGFSPDYGDAVVMAWLATLDEPVNLLDISIV